MKRDNIFIRFKNSIYNIRKIACYSKEGVGRALLYTLLLCLVLGIGKGISIGIRVNKSINQIESLLSEDKYKFKIENGELDVKTSPISEESSGILVYVNDEIKLEERNNINEVLVDSDMYLIILKDGIEIGSKNPEMLVNEYKIYYKDLPINILTNKEVIASLGMTKIFISIFQSIFQIIYTLIYYLMDALIVTVLSMLFNIIFRINLKYSEMYSMVLYVATLPNLIVLFFNIINPTLYLTYVVDVGTILFVFLILKGIRSDILNTKV